MPSSRAAAWARAPSRDAMPTISQHSPACMLGITRLTAIFATPNTPHRTFFMTWQLYRGGGRGRLKPQSEPRPSDGVEELVGRRKRLPHKGASPCAATWDRRFRLSTRQSVIVPQLLRERLPAWGSRSLTVAARIGATRHARILPM